VTALPDLQSTHLASKHALYFASNLLDSPRFTTRNEYSTQPHSLATTELIQTIRSLIFNEIVDPPYSKVTKLGCEHSNDHISTVPTPNANMLRPEWRRQLDLPSLQNSTKEKVCVTKYDLWKTAKKTWAQIYANSKSFEGQYSQLAPPKTSLTISRCNLALKQHLHKVATLELPWLFN